MKISVWRPWLCAAAIGLAAAMPVQAATVTFEDADPGFAFLGESLTSGGFKFTEITSDDTLGGFITIDSASALFAPPANPDGQFLGMFNSAGVVMSAIDGSPFFLNSFDAAFLAALPLQAGFLGGELTVLLRDLTNAEITETFVLPAGEVGSDYPFANFVFGASRGTAVTAAHFFSCAYQGDGVCRSGDLVPAQFALDNIDEGLRVPEPGAAVLALTALGMVLIRRRKATAA